MLKLLKHFNLPRDDLVTVFSGFVRELAEYAAPVGTLVLSPTKVPPWNESRKELAGSSWVSSIQLILKLLKVTI